MGGAVSSGKNNDDLVSKLIMADYIKSATIERVFRAVDRAEYFLPGTRANAYDDVAWKCGNLHISAPCIYSEVMEGLDLKPSLSFLNLGSGTGYLSTMVGLILGSNGVNHGIELHADVIEYANNRVEDFMKLSGAMDEFDFCEPKFVQGNCLHLTSEFSKSYDRIYCGAACPGEYAPFLKRLLNIDGILVFPINDQLLQVKRVCEAIWITKPLLAVSFASLVLPMNLSLDHIKPIEVEPMSLQVLCRAAIRNIIRQQIEVEYPPEPYTKRRGASARTLRKPIPRRVAVRDGSDSSSSDDDMEVILLPRYSHAGRRVFRREENGLLRFFMEIENMREEDLDKINEEWSAAHPRNRQEEMETDDNVSDENSVSHQVCAVIEHHPDPESSENQEEDNIDEPLEFVEQEADGNQANEPTESGTESDEQDYGNKSSLKNSDTEADDLAAKPSTSAAASSSAASPKSNPKREKFDSGLGDEIEVVSSSDEAEKENKRIDDLCRSDMDSIKKRDSLSDTDDEEATSDRDHEICMYLSPLTIHMTRRIQKLPLPQILKSFLNYDREFPVESKQE